MDNGTGGNHAYTISATDTIPDVDKARQPMYTTGGEERSGMGFTIMESFMDTMKVRSVPGRGTTVTMRKKIALRASVR